MFTKTSVLSEECNWLICAILYLKVKIINYKFSHILKSYNVYLLLTRLFQVEFSLPSRREQLWLEILW